MANFVPSNMQKGNPMAQQQTQTGYSMQRRPSNYPPGQLPQQGQMQGNNNQAGQQMMSQYTPQQMAQMMAANQANQQKAQTETKQQGAFPQNNNAASPHQMFIQEALRQGYSPDMVMQFLSNQLNLTPTKQ